MACRLRLLIISFALIHIGVSSFAQISNDSNDIEGYYWCKDPFTGEETQNIVYQAPDGSFEGKVTWVKNPKIASHVGLLFMTGLRFDAEKNEWSGGKVYYPGKKLKFSVVVHFDKKDSKKLRVRGYIGAEIFGMTTVWTKENALRTN
jgi:uncharacterized protein (DUF2147 family)